jgi:hypothetical protein
MSPDGRSKKGPDGQNKEGSDEHKKVALMSATNKALMSAKQVALTSAQICKVALMSAQITNCQLPNISNYKISVRNKIYTQTSIFCVGFFAVLTHQTIRFAQ